MAGWIHGKARNKEAYTFAVNLYLAIIVRAAGFQESDPWEE
jgi:hypothetical protein